MMDVKQIYREYLQDIKLMQLATCKGDKPWLCNVWYVMDKEDNVYWISRGTRRHSEEISENPWAACTFHKWFGEGLGVKGQALVMSGTVEVLTGDEIDFAYDLYAKRYPKLLEFQSLDESKNSTEEGLHYFYKLTPKEIVWFDEVNFPKVSKQVVM